MHSAGGTPHAPRQLPQPADPDRFTVGELSDEREPTTRAHLANMSPVTHAAAIRAPLLVAVGRKDPRVPPAVSDRLVDAVRGTGGTVWYLSADDEGHGFNKPTNRGALEVLITQLVER